MSLLILRSKREIWRSTLFVLETCHDLPLFIPFGDFSFLWHIVCCPTCCSFCMSLEFRARQSAGAHERAGHLMLASFLYIDERIEKFCTHLRRGATLAAPWQSISEKAAMLLQFVQLLQSSSDCSSPAAWMDHLAFLHSMTNA